VSDQSLKHAVLDAALKHAAKEDFTDCLLHKAAAEAGAAGDVSRLFPRGSLSLIVFWSSQADAEMERRLSAIALPAMPVSKRIRTAVLTRLDVLKPDKDAARRAAACLALPPNGPAGARLIYDTVDSMWWAIGDASADFSFYTKRGILAGVYIGTLLCWFKDATADARETTAFLDARIEDVVQYEKLKGRVREQCKSGLSQLSDLLRAGRGI
jgi:ubiquinone biosynthesis protein COQ9